MKRQRTISIIVVTVIVVAAIASITWQSYRQNACVRRDFTAFFTAVQQRNLPAVVNAYYGQSLDSKYEGQLIKYPLLGWKIKKITGQPFPMDLSNVGSGGQAVYNTLSADLYYQLSDDLVAPKGRYRKIDHPSYGPCVVVPVALDFTYQGEGEKHLIMPPPSLMSEKDWVAPFKVIQHNMNEM